MNKLLIISGPTATGKTSLAFHLARTLNGELVSADSRQVYREMTIVTGKEVDKDIKTWLLNVVEPDQFFNAADYYRLVWDVIKDIWKRGKLPILVGGTGFYIKAVLDGIETMGIEPDWKLRHQLETLTIEELQMKLQRLDPKRWERMNESDRRNPRRLIRAIEINVHLGGVPSEHPRGGPPDGRTGRMDSSGVNVFWLGLTAPFPILYNRIDQRVDERVKMGAVEETKMLADKFGFDIPSMSSQGYRELKDYIEGEISLDEAIKQWKFAEHEYARKQMTWFKKEKRIVWFEITDKSFSSKVEKKVRAWYIRSEKLET